MFVAALCKLANDESNWNGSQQMIKQMCVNHMMEHHAVTERILDINAVTSNSVRDILREKQIAG